MMLSKAIKIVNACKLCILYLVLSTITNAYAQDTITWGRTNTPPLFFLEGPYKYQGRYDQTILFLNKHMPEYKHELVQATLPRIYSEIKNGRSWCFVSATKTPEREAWAYFSIPSTLWLPNEILIRKDARAKFEKFLPELSLAALLADSSLVTHIYRGVSYGQTVDALLRQYPNLQLYSDTKEATQMLLAGRIDYVIWNRMTTFYAAKELMQENKLAALRFKEGSSFTAASVICPKNEWGKQVIQSVNRVLLEHRPSSEYRKITEAWVDEEGVQEIRRLYDSFFLKAE